MDEIMALAERHGLVVIEDAAHAINATYRGRALAAWGAIGCLSFHQTKDLVCGEGGALVIRDDGKLARWAGIVREKGTDRSAFLRGEREKYTWVAVGGTLCRGDQERGVLLRRAFMLPILERTVKHSVVRFARCMLWWRDGIRVLSAS
jgi:dTDP-4-amino-4,6-dideoxygalactose transaminase